MPNETHQLSHANGFFHLQVGDPHLNFREIDIRHPTPTARQILEAAGKLPAESHSVIAILEGGVTETLRMEETFDLRGRGVEKVVIFERTDRTFRFEIDRQERDWGAATITGRAIKFLINVDPLTYDLYQQKKGEDPMIRDEEVVDLSSRGIERFYTVISQTTEGSDFLPSLDKACLNERAVNYEMTSDGSQAAVILKAYQTPPNKFDHDTVDVLILLPGGYPDAPVDMFYCDPWLKLSGQGWPRAADQPFNFVGRNWQRWSRHNASWRPGIDGIHTVLARIDRALKEAA